jgi:hypothetical protein
MITAVDVIKKSQYFKEEDNWGDLNLVHYRLIEVLETYRKFLQSRVHISPFEPVYSKPEDNIYPPKSWHFAIQGRNKFSRAIKVFPECDLYEAFIMAMRFTWTGIVVHPYEEYPKIGTSGGDSTRGALTLDLRTAPNFRVLQYVDQNGKYHYINNVNDFDKLISIIKTR